MLTTIPLHYGNTCGSFREHNKCRNTHLSAHVLTKFLVLPSFMSSIETLCIFSISKLYLNHTCISHYIKIYCQLWISTHLFFLPLSIKLITSLTSVTICLVSLSTYTPSSQCSRTKKRERKKLLVLTNYNDKNIIQKRIPGIISITKYNTHMEIFHNTFTNNTFVNT